MADQGGDDSGSDDSGSGGDDGSDNSGSGSGDSDSGSGDDDGDDSDNDDEAGDADAGDDVSDGDREFIPDEVIVANPGAGFVEIVRNLGFTVLDQRPLEALGLTLTRLRVPRSMTALGARTLLAERFPDLVTDLNELYRPQAQLTLPAPNYAHELIGWGAVSAGCGRGIGLGMLDTAVDESLPALDGARIVQRTFLPAGAAAVGRDHGTAIAAVLVGQGELIGLLPAAGISVAEVFALDTAGKPVADVLAVAAGLDWLARQGVSVINLSLSGDRNRLMALAIRQTLARGMIVVAAAGNNGPGAPPAFPAAEPGVVAVTAIDSDKQVFADANQGPYVDFAAPGVRIWALGTDGADSYHSGTSFAAPYVTAAIAAAKESMDPDAGRLELALARAAEDLGAPGRDPVYGWGLLRASSPCGEVSQ
ncbi:MAG: S8 family serine peptidase [Dongiaceae bacterium]